MHFCEKKNVKPIGLGENKYDSIVYPDVIISNLPRSVAMPSTLVHRGAFNLP